MKNFSAKIIIYSFLVAVVFLFILDVYTWTHTKSFLIQEIREELAKKISLSKALMLDFEFQQEELIQLYQFTLEVKDLTSLRTTLIDRAGSVVADSEIKPENLTEVENHLYRPEVQEALREGSGLANRRSTTIGEKLFYYCETIKEQGRIIGFIRLAMFSPEFEAKMTFLRNLIITSNILILIMVAVIAILFGKWSTNVLQKIIDPLNQLRDVAHFGKLPSVGITEFDRLVNQVNRLGSQCIARVEQLDAYQKQLYTIFNSLNEGIAAFNKKGVAILHNKAFRKILGITETNESKVHFYDWIQFPPIIQDIEEFLNNPQPIHKRTKFYDNRYIDYQILPLIKEDQPLSGFLLTMEDVTHMQQLETIRQDFVANVTHEFKTPLTSIRGFAETLLTGNVDNKKTRNSFLKKIERQTIHLENLVGDLLQLSRIEKKKTGDVSKLNPIPLLKKAAQEFLPKFKEKNLNFEIDVQKADHKAKIRANKNLLHTIVSNLLSNAYQYTPSQGTVWFRTRIKKKHIRIEVEDSGPGIPKDEQQRIFERFYRLSSARFVYSEGSGLGLSIVKHSVELLSGTLGVKSEPGKGSLFWVEIPIA
jgi:two-component system phosphate regulon sensor histidine kinase PhoR